MTCSNFVKSTLPAAVLGFLALGIASTPAVAATTQTATFQVQATVANSCTITGSGITFGSYTGADVKNSSGTLTITCNTLPGTYTIGLSKGANGASTTARAMKSPLKATTLNYSLFSDNGYSVNWDDIGGAHPLVGSAAGPLTIYAEIPAGQTTAAVATDYADTITATISY